VFGLAREIVVNMTVCDSEELLLVKVSFEPHHFPGETDPESIGYSPPSFLVMCAPSSTDTSVFMPMRNLMV